MPIRQEGAIDLRPLVLVELRKVKSERALVRLEVQRGADIGRDKPGIAISQEGPHRLSFEAVLSRA